MSVIHLNNREMFAREVLSASTPVLVDFWAEWCGPCQSMTPEIEELARKFPQIKVCKLNVDDVPEPAMQYGIDSIPAFLLFEHGEFRARTIGAMPMEALAKRLGLME